MVEHAPQHRIYLDLDGVILPYGRRSDQVEPQGQVGADTRWIDHEFYHPMITKRLGDLAARGVCIIPSSSRSLDMFIFYSPILEDLGNLDRFLVIDKFRSGDVSLKAEAVVNNWQAHVDLSNERRGWERQRSMVDVHPTVKPQGSRAVWIDDHASPEKFTSDKARQILAIDSLRVIQPIGAVGLTMLELDEVEAFLFKGEHGSE